MRHLETRVLLLLVLAGCATDRADRAWPEPRPLGRELATFRPPLGPPPVPLATEPRLEEPQGAVTLQQVLSLALTSNPELAAAAWDVRAGEARTLQAGLFLNPELELELEEFGGTGDRRGVNALAGTLSLSQTFELGGKPSSRARAAALDTELAGWDYETRRLDLLTEVTKDFMNVLAAQENLALAGELVRLSEKILEVVAERVGAGKVSPLEETRARVTLATSRIDEQRTRRDLALARKRLASDWGSASPGFERAEGDLDSIMPIPTFEQVASRLAQSPYLARWTTELEQRRAVVEREEASQYPNLTVGAGVQYFNEAREPSAVVHGSIPLPLFDRNQGALLEAQCDLAQAEHERRAASVQIHRALGEAYESLSNAHTEAVALKDQVLPVARQAFEATGEGYRQGKFGFLDLLDAQRTLFEVRTRYLEVLASYHQAVAEVERWIGEPLAAIPGTVEHESKETENEH